MCFLLSLESSPTSISVHFLSYRYVLSCVPAKDAVVLALSACECHRIWM